MCECVSPYFCCFRFVFNSRFKVNGENIHARARAREHANKIGELTDDEQLSARRMNTTVSSPNNQYGDLQGSRMSKREVDEEDDQHGTTSAVGPIFL